MNEYNANNPSEMLHLLLDGELESSKEPALFAELSHNNELRQELNDLLSIRQSVANDKEAFTPPLSATNKVFANMGFTAPTVATVAEKSSKSKYWLMASPLLGLLLLFFYPNSSDNLSDIASVDAYSTVVQRASITPATSNDKPQEENHMIVSSISNKPVKVENATSQISLDQHSEYNNMPIRTVSYADNFSNTDKNYRLNNSAAVIENTQYSGETIQLSQIMPNGLTIQLKSISSASSNGSANYFGDMDLSVLIYNFGDLDLGLQAGIAHYTLEKSAISTIGNYTANIETKVFWAGLTARYCMNKPVSWLLGSQPYVQASLGATSHGYGWTWKYSLGLTRNIYKNINCFVGFENSGLEPYESYISPAYNWGISYGLSIKL